MINRVQNVPMGGGIADLAGEVFESSDVNANVKAIDTNCTDAEILWSNNKTIRIQYTYVWYCISKTVLFKNIKYDSMI